MAKEREWNQHILLKTLTTKGKEEINKAIISDVTPELFTSSAYRKAVNIILEYYQENNTFISWGELLRDPNLGEKTASFLRAREIRRKKLRDQDDSLILPVDKEGVHSVIGRAKHDAQLSKLFELQNELTENLNIDLTPESLEPLLNLCKDTIDDIEGIRINRGSLFEVNKESVKIKLKDFYKAIKNRFFIPTGFIAFDSVNLGLPMDSFMIISGKSGTGKSALAVQLAINFKKSGARVCFMPLEMSEEQMLLRIASNLLSIPVNELVKNLKLYYKDIVKTITRFISKGDGCLHFYTPDVDETYQQALTNLRPFGYDVTIADYIGLFAESHPEQSKSLDRAARFGKIYATKNKSLTIALAQLDDDADRIRYSRAMKEHGCLVGNSLISSNNGFIPIKEIAHNTKEKESFETSLSVDTYQGVNTINQVHSLGKKHVYTTILEDGRKLQSTKEHKFMVLTENIKLKWVEVKDIKVGDYLVRKADNTFSTSYVKFKK